MYRVDRRQYKIGDVIYPDANSYQNGDNFNSEKVKLENILEKEKLKEITICRNSGLYVFSELSDAIRFSCVMTDSKIYKVKSTAETTLYHRGYMYLTEVMNKANIDEEALRALAQSYWNSEKTFKPCWEVLVNKVQVTKIIIGENESRNKFVQNLK